MYVKMVNAVSMAADTGAYTNKKTAVISTRMRNRQANGVIQYKLTVIIIQVSHVTDKKYMQA
jgi:hypothetical protein